MRNQAMQRKLRDGEAIDVEKVSEPMDRADQENPELRGTWKLTAFEEMADYCVVSTEQWIWSIGKRASDGAIFAALDGRFYQNPGFECVWLR